MRSFKKILVPLTLLTLFFLIPHTAAAQERASYAVVDIYFEDSQGDIILVSYEDAVNARLDSWVSGNSALYDALVSEFRDALQNSRDIWLRVRVSSGNSELFYLIINYSEALKKGVSLKELVNGYPYTSVSEPDHSSYFPEAEPAYDSVLILNSSGVVVKLAAERPPWLADLIIVRDEILDLWVVDVILDRPELPGLPVDEVMVRDSVAQFIAIEGDLTTWRALLDIEEESFWEFNEPLNITYQDVTIKVGGFVYRWDTPY